MRKFPKLKYPNDPETDGLKAGDVVVTEKLDGANFRFTWNDSHELVVGTRNHDFHEDDENLPKAFEHAVEYIQDTVEYQPHFGNYTIFGEAMHLHSLEYEDVEYEIPSKGSAYFESEPNFIMFDAWDNISKEWLSWGSVITLADEMGLTTTQVLERGEPEELNFNVPDESMFGGPPEGIVIRRYNGSVRAKIVTDDFCEKNETAFNNASRAQTDAGEFVVTYITDARIKKMAHKLVDRGKYDHLQMEMMEDLPRKVLKDVMAENGWELLTNGSIEVEWGDDFKSKVRSKTSKKCARVLKNEVQSL